MPVYLWTETDERERREKRWNVVLGCALCISIALLAYLMVAGL